MAALSTRTLIPLLAALLILGPTGPAAATEPGARRGDSTLDAVRDRGELRCIAVLDAEKEAERRGSVGGIALFETLLCRALAAAVLGDPERIRIVPVGIADRAAALASGDADLSFGTMTVTARRDLTVAFPLVLFFDSQTVMAPAALGVRTLAEAGEITACVVPGSTTALNLADYAARHRLPLQAVPITSTEAQVEGYLAGRCKVMVGDRFALLSLRPRNGLRTEDHVILEDALSLEPIGPMIRRNDPDWAHVVRWVFNALVLAEEKGVTRESLDRPPQHSDDPEVRRLLGLDPHPLTELGLPADSLVQALRVAGNYGELYRSAFGPGTVYDLPRGRNALVRDGGLMLPMPYR